MGSAAILVVRLGIGVGCGGLAPVLLPGAAWLFWLGLARLTSMFGGSAFFFEVQVGLVQLLVASFEGLLAGPNHLPASQSTLKSPPEIVKASVRNSGALKSSGGPRCAARSSGSRHSGQLPHSRGRDRNLAAGGHPFLLDPL